MRPENLMSVSDVNVIVYTELLRSSVPFCWLTINTLPLRGSIKAPKELCVCS